MLKIYENKIVNNAKFLQTLGMTDEFLRFLKESNSYFSWKKNYVWKVYIILQAAFSLITSILVKALSLLYQVTISSLRFNPFCTTGLLRYPWKH